MKFDETLCRQPIFYFAPRLKNSAEVHGGIFQSTQYSAFPALLYRKDKRASVCIPEKFRFFIHTKPCFEKLEQITYSCPCTSPKDNQRKLSVTFNVKTNKSDCPINSAFSFFCGQTARNNQIRPFVTMHREAPHWTA